MKLMRFVAVLQFLLVPLVYGQESNTLEAVLQKGHAKKITCYAFSPDSRYVVTGSSDNSVILWNIENGRQIRVFNRHSEPVLSVFFSPDGTHILTASADNSAKVFEISTGRLLITIKLADDELEQAFYSPAGTHVVLFDSRDGMHVYDATTGKKIQTLSRSYGLMNYNGIINKANTKIITAYNYEKFYVCDLVSGDTLSDIEFDKPFLMSFSPDEKYIAASSTKLFTKVFDAATGKELYDLRDGEEECDGCNTKHVFSNSGKYLVTMSSKVDAIAWDLATGTKIRSFSSFRERPYGLKFSPDDSHILLSFDQDVFVYELKTGKEKIHLTADNIDYFDFNFSADSKMILVPGSNNEAMIYDVETGRKKKSLQGFLNKKRDDGLRFNDSYWTDERILKFISLKRNVALSPDNKHIAIGNVDSTALVLSLETGKIVHLLSGHTKVVFALDYSPDGKMLATAGGDRTICLWNTQTGELIKKLTGHGELIFDLAFNADGSKLSSGSWDGTMRIWDMNDLGEYYRMDLGNVSPYAVGFTNNGLYAVTGDLDRNVDFWEMDAGSSFRTLVGHTGVISAFDFSPDGKQIVTSSWDGKVKVWDILTGMLIAKMTEHDGPVYSVCYDPKARFIASGSADNDIILWITELNTFYYLKGHTSPVTSITFNADGTRLISCDAEGMVKVWDIENRKALYSRIQISRNEWLATSTDGAFDGSSKSLELVNYVSGMEVLPVGSLFDKYYTPGLIEKIMKGERSTTTGENLHNILKTSPQIAFELAETGSRSVLDPDSVISWKQAVLPLGIRINSQGQTIDEIRVYNNGKLVVQESMQTDLVFRGETKDVRHFEIPLTDGENELSAVVINSDRTESSPVELTVLYDGVAALTDLFILSVGINTYKNPQYNLDYAVNDAQSFVKAISAGADSLFNSIKTFEIFNEQAIKANISDAVSQIRKEIGPEDVFVFYYAGHGVMSVEKLAENSDFFIVTHDITNLYSETEVLRQKALSATELMEFSKLISAEKQLFILDACHSGGALDAFASRGDGREKTLAQLARSTGTFFITASQDAQYANEAGDLQHGLFTYALLEILNGQRGNNGDEKITISELKVYVEERVPELSEQYHGTAQYPTSYSFGQDFPIVILK
ncbi:MAG: caspase family protein [Bacteroidetes bacterium]|nr:caspase family protein [Bacteroidota bacterium]